MQIQLADTEPKGFLAGLGLPDHKTEHWRMTPIARFKDHAYRLEKPVLDDAAITAAITHYKQVFTVAQGRLLVLCDGAYLEGFSDLAPNDDGHQFPNIDSNRLPFAAQNTETQSTVWGLNFIGDMGECPIHVLCLQSGTADNANFARLHIRIGASSTVNIVESHLSLNLDDQSDYAQYSNMLVHVDVAKNACVGHYKWQDLSLAHLHIAASQVQVADSAHYDGFVLNMGSLLARQDIELAINGSDANAAINGAYIGLGRQHLDNTSQIQHKAPNSFSREVYKGVLADQAKGVFQARIHVHQIAQLTDAYQMNRALLLSPETEVNAKPELEIYADDVKCSHGATVGELEHDQLFYLRSRGISEAQARMMLIEAYLEDVFNDIEHTEIAEQFAEIARQKLKIIAEQAS